MLNTLLMEADSEAFGQTVATGMTAVSNVISIGYYIVLVIASWFLFEKAGEAGWKSLIPLYNAYTEFKIIYGNGWKCLLLLVPILNIVVSIMYCYRLAQVYGKGTLFGILTIFFTPIMLIVLAFDKNATYQGPVSSFL